MKYKVVFINTSGSGNRSSSAVSFYKLAVAQSAAEQWREIDISYYAYLWNGSTWTEYAPIP